MIMEWLLGSEYGVSVNKQLFGHQSPQSSFFLTPVDENKIFSIIYSMNGRKSATYDEITIKVIKIYLTYILKIYYILYNNSFSIKVFPDILKTSKIIPLFKKGYINLIIISN